MSSTERWNVPHGTMDEESSMKPLCLLFVRQQGRDLDCSSSFLILWWEGLGADSREKRGPASDIDTGVVDSLKALDPERPIRGADIARLRIGPGRDSCTAAKNSSVGLVI